jgi:cyclic pyranopterin phosphate synthase
MPFSANSWEINKVMRSGELLEKILQHYDIIKLTDDIHDTAKKYKVPGYAGDFGMISTVSEPFCSGCNRLRLTADGKMRNCLFAQTDTDLLTPLRNGEDVIPLIKANVQAKYFQ